MDPTYTAHSHCNEGNRSKEIFTFSRSEESLLTLLFPESTEQNTLYAFNNNTQRDAKKTKSSENSDFKQTSTDKHSAPSEDIEEEPKFKPQQLLLWALQHNKFERFSSLLKVPGVDPRLKYGKPHYTTCIELACKLQWGGKFVKVLLEHGVKPNVHEIHPEPIHYAAKYGNPEALEALLQNKKTKINIVDSSGRTALHHTVRYSKKYRNKYSKKQRDAEYEHCIELLLKRPDLVLNIPNNSGYTAVHEAANSNHKKAVELILKYRKDDVDLDSYSKRGRTARECILSKYPELRPLLPEYQIKYQSLDHNSQLLIALQNRQLKIFHNILCLVDEDGRARVDPNYCYGRPHFATCLVIACREKDCAEFVKELLGAGADPNFVNPKTKKTALQVAVETRNIHVLNALLEDRRTNINAVHDELQRVITDLDQQRDNEEIMQDYEEAKQYKEAIQELKCVLHTRMSEIQSTLLKHTNIDKSQSGQILFQHIYKRNYEDFKKKFAEAYKDIDDGNYTLLQYATICSFKDVVQLLLESGADPNATTKFEKQSPILIACMNNDHEMMKLLLSSTTSNKLDVNVTDAKGNTPLYHVSKTEHLDCVVYLMRCGADMKHKNIFNKSPLPAKSVEKFLDKSLQTNDKFPSDEEYKIIFDYSFLVAHNEKDTQPNPPQEGEQLLTHDHETGVRNVQFPEKLKPEMDFLFYMSESDEHRKIMQHPIITSFLHMKWQRVKLYFYINICMYFIFAILLNAYILLKIGDNSTNGSESGITSNDTKTSQSNSTSTGFHVAWFVILFFLLYFTMRELLQLALSPKVKKEFLHLVLSPKVYFTNYENILDLSIIVFSGYILFLSEWQESCVVITIILSWTELILLTGRLPKLSRNIEMLKTVSLNYFWFLFSYFFLLIAFAFSFYSLFHKNATKSSTKDHDKKDQYFFMNPIMSVMKTFVMMMGEFQAESIEYEMAYSPTFSCLFALFVFIIAMVLLNLLTGLAVSNTHDIESNADQLSLVSRIRLVYEIESTLLQWYTFVEKWSKCTLLHTFTNFQKSMIKNISLFPDTSNKKRIHILPNKGPNIVFENDGLNKGKDGDELDSGHTTLAYGGSRFRYPCICNLCSKCNGHNTSCKMTSAIIGEATRIISIRSESDVNNMKENFGQIQEAFKKNESQLSKIEYKMENLFENYQKKLDAINRKLEHDKIQSKNRGTQKMKHYATTSHKVGNKPH